MIFVDCASNPAHPIGNINQSTLMKKQLLLLLVCISTVCVFTACESYNTQTTSGQDYLSKYPTPTGEGTSADVDQEVREVANVEPTLRFPARIGLAKLFNGKITNLSAEEVEAWTKAREELGSEFGEFVPVSALIAESVYTAPPSRERGGAMESRASEIIRKVRLGSARQHLDVVLIYEVFSETNTTSLATSVADWTIIGGYFVPSKEIKTVGYANALLMDVRSGYPYGTASASLTDEGLSTTWGNSDKVRNLSDKNQIATVVKLVPEVEKMMRELMEKLGGPSENPES